jgi:hypothetical protein
VAERLNSPRERRWQLSVDQKAQSCAPQDRVIVLAGGEFQYCRDVFRFEVRVIGEDFFAAGAGGQKVEHVLHPDAEAANARAATTDVCAHRDSVNRAHVLSAAQRAPDNTILSRVRIARAPPGRIDSSPGSRVGVPNLARRAGTFGDDAMAHTLFHIFGERFHRFLSDLAAFTPCQRSIGFVHHCVDFEASALTLFPQGKSFFDRFFLASEPALFVARRTNAR